MRTSIMCLAFVFVFVAGVSQCSAQEQQRVKKAMVLQVAPGTIALPEGEAARVPVSAARIRSTDMRDLNTKYTVVAMEKLYQLADDAAPLPGSGSTAVLSAGEKKPEAPALDLSKVLRSEMRKKAIEDGREVVELPDTYLVEFEVEPNVEMKDVVVAYWVLPVVTFAQEVTPEE